jgi:Cu2+-exporting ATPase
MNPQNDTLCCHCLLPVGLRPLQRNLRGERRTFCCYGCCIAYQVHCGQGEEWEAARLLIRLGVGSFLAMNIMLFSFLFYANAFSARDAPVVRAIDFLLWLLATPALVILGGPFLRETWNDALSGRLAASALIVLGVGAAYLYSVIGVLSGGTRVYFDTAAMVMMLFTLGRYLEAAGRARAARDLEPLLAAESELATVIDGAVERRLPAREVKPGMMVRIKPGERIPIDGTVIEGECHADEAVITGESRQVAKTAGSSVVAGSINLDGVLLTRVDGAGRDTRWAQIGCAVREALLRRGPTQRAADRVVGAFVPLVLALAGMTVIYWSTRVPFDRGLIAGLAVLTVACPCAVGLAIPLATSLGIGRLARLGCIVRSPGTLESLARLRLIAFDKTGTLTSGVPRLVSIESEDMTIDATLARAAGLERHSEHGLARAIRLAAAARRLEPAPVHGVHVIPGRGILGKVSGETIAAGSKAFMDELGWPCSAGLARCRQQLEAGGHSAVYVGWEERVRAVLAFDELPLPEARATVAALGRLGLRVGLLTGDLEGPAQRLAAAVGIEEWRAGLTPEAKRAALDRQRNGTDPVAMVGDGLNDGLALAGAEVGIAVSSATDLARETADIVLPPGGLVLLPWIIGLARAVRATFLANLAWAFGYNLIALSAAALGLLQPILAAAVMAGSSILVVMNSLRLERYPDPQPPAAQHLTPPATAGHARTDWLGRRAVDISFSQTRRG